MELFKIQFINFSLKDFIDIFLVAFLFYRLYLIMRKTRAAQMLLGLVIIVLVSLLAQVTNMSGLNWFFDQVKTVWIIAFVIIFQPELRRLLVYAGQNPLLRKFLHVSEQETLEEVAKTAEELSRRRYGGLIVLTRDVELRGVIETGVRIDAVVSQELIVSLFSPRSVLHDGAIIIHDDVIVAAKCILPLSENLDQKSPVGTRHRAALGIAEESDAIVVVVSEESGRISIAVEGELITNLEYQSLLKLLVQSFNKQSMMISSENSE